MKKRKADNSALSVIKRITDQESLLAQAALMESMHKLNQAESREQQLMTRQKQHHEQIASTWRSQNAHALLTLQTTAPYRTWLKGEVSNARTVVESLSAEADTAKDHEARLRAEGRLLDELLARRTEREAKERELRSFKETDELVVMRPGKVQS